jgi:hypothetical protein
MSKTIFGRILITVVIIGALWKAINLLQDGFNPSLPKALRISAQVIGWGFILIVLMLFFVLAATIKKKR